LIEGNPFLSKVVLDFSITEITSTGYSAFSENNQIIRIIFPEAQNGLEEGSFKNVN
jgi:hypothetical protein